MLLKKDLAAEIARTIAHYRGLESMAGFSLVEQTKKEYADMALGGDGGEATYVGEPLEVDEAGNAVRWQSVRDHNYPGYPDEYFQEVCDL